MTRGLDTLIEVQGQAGPADERLEELERTRATWEAQMEALLMKADSTLKSAANAESRSRTMMKHAEKLADPLDLEGAEIEDVVPDGYAPGGEAQGVLPLRVDVAPSHKQIALRHKFS